MRGSLRPLVGVLLAAGSISACGFGERGVQRFHVDPQSPPATTWAELFGDERRIPLDFAAAGGAVFASNTVMEMSDGRVLVADPRAGRMLAFGPDGSFQAAVGRKGEGPGEFQMLRDQALDAEDRMVTFDVQSNRITTFSPPEFAVSASTRTMGTASQIAAVPRGVVLFSHYDPESILRLVDRQGFAVERALRPDSKSLALFLARFQNGAVTGDGRGGVWAIYPETFTLHRLDGDLKPLVKITDRGQSEWRPDSPAFPEALSPYDYSPAHQQWWDSHLHVFQVFQVGPGVVAVSLYRSKGLSSVGDFLNLYTEDGAILAEGLEIPTGQVLGAKDCRLWVGKNAWLDDEGTIRDFELRRYTLRADRCPLPVAAAG